MNKEILKQKVWNKGRPYGNLDPALFQIDECGALMSFDEYGNRESEFGWETDHIIPIADGGTDDISNLRPLQWDNNASRGKGKLLKKVSFDGFHNKINPNWNIVFE